MYIEGQPRRAGWNMTKTKTTIMMSWESIVHYNGTISNLRDERANEATREQGTRHGLILQQQRKIYIIALAL